MIEVESREGISVRHRNEGNHTLLKRMPGLSSRYSAISELRADLMRGPAGPIEPVTLGLLSSRSTEREDALEARVAVSTAVSHNNVYVKGHGHVVRPGYQALLCTVHISDSDRSSDFEDDMIHALAFHLHATVALVTDDNMLRSLLPVVISSNTEARCVEVWTEVQPDTPPGFRVVLVETLVVGHTIVGNESLGAGALVAHGIQPPCALPMTCKQGHITPVVSAAGIIYVPQVRSPLTVIYVCTLAHIVASAAV
jgi:hypothetical protein